MELSDDDKAKKSADSYIKATGAYSIADGAAKQSIVPFAISLGASNFQIGLLSAVPQFLSNLSQINTSKLMEKHARKKLSLLGCYLEMALWIVIVLMAAFSFYLKNDFGIWSLIIIYSILLSFSFYYVPAIGSWLKDVVLHDMGKYFARKDKVKWSMTLVSMLAAGIILDFFGVQTGFILVFCLGFLGIFGYTSYVKKMEEPPLQLKKGYYFTFWQFVKYIPQSNFGKFTLFRGLVNFAFHFAYPFLTVYMLKTLGFSYTMWIAVVMAEGLFIAISLPFWGRFVDKYGTIRVYKMTALVLPLVPLLWYFSPKASSWILLYLILAAAFSGFVRSGLSLAANNFQYDAVTRQRMALCVAYNNVITFFFIFLGGILGGYVASLPETTTGMLPLLLVFLIGSTAGFIFYVLMSGRIKEVRDVPKFGIKEAREEFMAVTQKQTVKLR